MKKASVKTPKRPASASDPASFPNIGMTLSSYTPSQGSAAAVATPMPVRRNYKLWFKRAFITLMIIVLVAGGWVGAKFLINTGRLFNGNLFGLLHSTHLKGEDVGRVNILVAGNSADDPGHNGANLTDSIMILSVDTKNNTAFMISVPRDLWVSVPGHGHQKINAVYQDGEADNFSEDGYPAGGMGELEKVVHRDFGIDINYYALVDYAALKNAVDAVGGVDFTVHSTDPRGLYDPSIDWTTHGPLVKLSNGTHHLDGQQALDLARARGDAYGSYGFEMSDYKRTEDQRQLLVALKDKATAGSTLANPIKVGSLLDSFGSNVKTDFQTNEARRLFDIAHKVPSSSIKSVGLNDVNGKSLLRGYTSYDGQSALIPAAGVDNYYAIQAYLQELMTPPAPSSSN